MTENPDIVITVLVSRELLEEMRKRPSGWSPPCQVRIYETPGAGTGWEMEARTVEALP